MRAVETAPKMTVAIPHYKHRQYLQVVLETVLSQDCDSFELLVSDDCSPDDSAAVIPDMLLASGRPFRYYTQPSNLGYDGNVRFCLAAAQGRYVLLLGNDDALAGPDIVRRLIDLLSDLGNPAVAFVNFSDYETGAVVARAQRTQLLGAGPETALRYFRSFSFVAGLIYDREYARQHETDRWDQSIYYQIYLAGRIIASGNSLAAIALTAVRKDVRVAGDHVFNYAVKWANAPWSFQSRHTGMDSVIRVTADAILPFVPAGMQSATLRQIINQILTITYPYWLMEYRRVANWSFAVGIARSMWPGRLLAEYTILHPADRLRIWFRYVIVTVGGLFIPASLFHRIKERLAGMLRQRQQNPTPAAPIIRDKHT